MNPPNRIFLRDGERLDTVNENITLIQKKNGLTYGTDAYLLAAFLRPQPNADAVELGAGTGIVSLLACAKNKCRRVFAVEIQPEFSDLIARNAELNGQSDRVIPVCADLRALPREQMPEKIGLVFANPPYMTTSSGRLNPAPEKETARHECFGGIFDFCRTASNLLSTKGRFVCVFRPDRLIDLTVALRENRLEPKRMCFVCADEKTAPSMVLVESVKDASKALTLLPPLLLWEEREGKRVMSAQAEAIYQTCQFQSRDFPGSKF